LPDGGIPFSGPPESVCFENKSCLYPLKSHETVDEIYLPVQVKPEVAARDFEVFASQVVVLLKFLQVSYLVVQVFLCLFLAATA
jgi:hypothetical protein